ncbi:hypothetical protein IEQ34_008093 [Dendrobium chrysotoxum]|uniref:Uncharacterized protein n=1 Tax=Dendrobium chrysotoxum TaxID=161865 RepID=A0AAV7H357_DENCH|nr:hypothetical protein IEQ34_008093 [Dendrobium chrysotoxum]
MKRILFRMVCCANLNTGFEYLNDQVLCCRFFSELVKSELRMEDGACYSTRGWHIVSLLCPPLMISVQPGRVPLLLSAGHASCHIPDSLWRRPDHFREHFSSLHTTLFSASSHPKAGPEMFLKSFQIQMLEIKERDVLISFPIEVEQWFLQTCCKKAVFSIPPWPTIDKREMFMNKENKVGGRSGCFWSGILFKNLMEVKDIEYGRHCNDLTSSRSNLLDLCRGCDESYGPRGSPGWSLFWCSYGSGGDEVDPISGSQDFPATELGVLLSAVSSGYSKSSAVGSSNSSSSLITRSARRFRRWSGTCRRGSQPGSVGPASRLRLREFGSCTTVRPSSARIQSDMRNASNLVLLLTLDDIDELLEISKREEGTAMIRDRQDLIAPERRGCSAAVELRNIIYTGWDPPYWADKQGRRRDSSASCRPEPALGPAGPVQVFNGINGARVILAFVQEHWRVEEFVWRVLFDFEFELHVG